ncbi:MAG: c-type cytochrome [Devosia sp.]|nr:c-type cytochrome [Devosia sp.]
MNKKRAIRLLCGGALVVAVAATPLTVTGLAYGLESLARVTNEARPAQQTGTRIRLAQANATPVEKPVSYSSEQADRGKKTYDQLCEDCHGEDLKGGVNGGALLAGRAFLEKYTSDQMPASGLYLFMSTLMPPDSPGSLSSSTYVDLLAYVLKRNGFAEGAPLPSNPDALDYLIFGK